MSPYFNELRMGYELSGTSSILVGDAIFNCGRSAGAISGLISLIDGIETHARYQFNCGMSQDK